jgi:hypothetical protein
MHGSFAMNAIDRWTRRTALAALTLAAQSLDAVAARLDGQAWPFIAIPLVWLADAIERCRSRLEGWE